MVFDLDFKKDESREPVEICLGVPVFSFDWWWWLCYAWVASHLPSWMFSVGWVDAALLSLPLNVNILFNLIKEANLLVRLLRWYFTCSKQLSSQTPARHAGWKGPFFFSRTGGNLLKGKENNNTLDQNAYHIHFYSLPFLSLSNVSSSKIDFLLRCFVRLRTHVCDPSTVSSSPVEFEQMPGWRFHFTFHFLLGTTTSQVIN